MLTIFATALFLAQAEPPPPAPLAPTASVEPAAVDVDPYVPRFGERHQIVTSVALNLSGSYTANSDGNSSFSLSLAPAVDYFVLNNFSIGGRISGGYSGTRSPTASTDQLSTGIAPRIGYNIPLTKRLSLWPKLIVAVDYNTPVNAKLNNAESTVTLAAELNLPLVITLAPHVFWGVGPYLVMGTHLYTFQAAAGIGGNPPNQYVTVGLGTQVGGYF
jgi:hypothetical protein